MDIQKHAEHDIQKVCSKKSENGEQEQNYAEFDRYMQRIGKVIQRVCKNDERSKSGVIENTDKRHG